MSTPIILGDLILFGTPVNIFCFFKERRTRVTVTIGTENTIAQLKELLKKEESPYTDNICSTDLTLWHVNVDPSAINTIDEMLNNNNKLTLPTKKVGGIFSDLSGKKIRVVIGIPVCESFFLFQINIIEEQAESLKRQYSVSNYDEEQYRNVKKIRNHPSPSSFALINYLHENQSQEQEFLIGRPSGCIGIPLMLYNYAFTCFKTDFNNDNLPIDKDHYQWTLNCINTMSNFYSIEKFRKREFHERMRELFNKDIMITVLDDESSNDGALYLDVHSFTILYLNIEIKNEIGTGNCDPTTQAAAFYAKFYAQKKYEEILKGCNMPCFILGLAGPWICVLGAKIARLFMALRTGCDNLKKYYKSLSKSVLNIADSQQFFPYIRTAHGVGDFVYKEKLFDDPNKLLWKAETKSGQTIIVKFSHMYNANAHNLCHEIGKAPELLFVSKISNEFCMIIMEYVKGQRLYDCEDLDFPTYKKIINDIEVAISHLHSKNIVFADLRDSNILVIKDDNKTYHGMLIDFDWAGEDNVECYPSFMNPNINWPLGAGDKVKLKKEHDIHWLKVLKDRYLKNEDEPSNF
ncbi:17650_t:CDS:2 [Dentiscutata erythropus]|uniref:17650_t:CDS:1 n=1 Tax=Dentiscutata erythropus TaxID=1348616 RepID=A0A9N8Z0S2_9GLOM|nr:17650_t:CDS:2 [Dentiscutata erythropus]